LISLVPARFASENLGFEEAFLFWEQVRSEILKLGCGPALVRELELFSQEDLLHRFGGLEDVCCYLADLLYGIKRKDSAQSDLTCVNDSFLRLLDHIRKNYASELYLKELADDFHINFTYCCDLFKKVTSMTFSQFLAETRMKKARELLSETGIPVEEIGSSVGFRDYHYFIAVFKKYTKLTPSQYRKEMQKSGRAGM
jgi:two-component system response regulator YesN